MTKVDRALEMQVIDWLQWGKFPEGNNLPGLALELINKRKQENKRLIEQGNYLDSALTGMLEGDEVECRSDEDCDHCFAVQAGKEWTEVLSETGSEPERK